MEPNFAPIPFTLARKDTALSILDSLVENHATYRVSDIPLVDLVWLRDLVKSIRPLDYGLLGDASIESVDS